MFAYLIGARNTCFQTNIIFLCEKHTHAIFGKITTEEKQKNPHRIEILVEAFDVKRGDVANLHIAYNVLYDMICIGDIWGTITKNQCLAMNFLVCI